jgi:hypothetical protein
VQKVSFQLRHREERYKEFPCVVEKAKGGDGRSLLGQKCGDMIEPNPIKILMRWCPGANGHKRIISLAGRDDDIHFRLVLFLNRS